MLVCPKCKSTTVIDDNKFCYKDGEQLVPQKECVYCGRGLLEGIDVYCSRCGNKVELKDDTDEIDIPF